MQGPIDYAMRDLRITTSGDVAFCHGLGHVLGTRTTGENVDYWVRVTTGFRRTNGRWLVNHEHVSMPVEMQASGVEGGVKPQSRTG